MGDIFNLDNKFFQTLGKGVDCVCLSLLWMICCIPLAFGIYVAYVSKAIILALPCIVLAVPAGIATTALYYAVNKVIRHSRGYLWSSFWHSFKTNMKQGAFVTLIVAAAVVLVGLDGYIMYQFAKAGEKSGVLYVVFFVLMLVVIAWAIYVFPYMARFENSTKLILKNSGADGDRQSAKDFYGTDVFPGMLYRNLSFAGCSNHITGFGNASAQLYFRRCV